MPINQENLHFWINEQKIAMEVEVVSTGEATLALLLINDLWFRSIQSHDFDEYLEFVQ